jgi:hypothetical protein
VAPLCLLGALTVPALARALPGRRQAVGAIAVAGLMLVPVLSTPAQPSVGPDYFQTLALWLRNAPPGPLISAAPDAFGYLLPGRAQQEIVPGERGLILLDAAQREYVSSTNAAGRVLESYAPDGGFERPDGTIDSAPARLISGLVISARAS